ncbi:hypothetical protein PIB30_079690 [Stylosanthes scabra]|uniref:Uncharacterized protein n=1 Tax=Stylosanthes scabra TaxID=79078 RepID=A0ABU6YRZ9_9FABA|nr:hypothetical protein [Stylosanthes scabra]
MQKSQVDYMEEVKQIKEKQEEMWSNNQRFQSQFRQEQERLAREIQEVRKSQISQTLANNKRLETEKNLQQAVERQGRDIAEMRKNTSAREAYTCWAHQQANPNLSEIPLTQIPDLMQTNAEKGRPMFYGCLKSDYGASTSSQADPQEPVPLRTAPPIPGDQTMDSSKSYFFGTFSDEEIEVEDRGESDDDSEDDVDGLEEKRIAELSRDEIMRMEF